MLDSWGGIQESPYTGITLYRHVDKTRRWSRSCNAGDSVLPPQPPNNHEKPENNDEEYHVTYPPSALSFCHGIQSPERSAEYVASFAESIILNGNLVSDEGKRYYRIHRPFVLVV